MEFSMSAPHRFRFPNYLEKILELKLPFLPVIIPATTDGYLTHFASNIRRVGPFAMSAGNFALALIEILHANVLCNEKKTSMATYRDPPR